MEAEVKEVVIKEPAAQEQKLIPRDKAHIYLAFKFLAEHLDMVKHFPLGQQIEITEHLIGMVQLMEKNLKQHDEANYYEYLRREAELLKKYGKTFKPFIEKSFCNYFYYELALIEKSIYTQEQYDSFPYSPEIFFQEEAMAYHYICLTGLNHAKNKFYLQREPQFEISQKELESETEPKPESDKEITKARQLLTIYYLLKAGFGVEHRVTGDVSQIAKFIHLLTGTKFTTLQNSDIYKKYLKMPNYKKDKELIKDLKFIRVYFSELALYNVVQLIDEEIEKAKKELKRG